MNWQQFRRAAWTLQARTQAGPQCSGARCTANTAFEENLMEEYRRAGNGVVLRSDNCLPRRNAFRPVRSMRVDTRRSLGVICGLGPSLLENLEPIKEYREFLFLVAPVRGAMRLAECGVIPDVVVLLESGALQYDLVKHQLTDRFLQSLGRNGTVLVTHITAPRPIVRRFREHVRVFYFADDRAFPRSVALPNWNQSLFAATALAIESGFRRIGIVGVDLGPEGFRHQLAALESFRLVAGISLYDFGSGVAKRGWQKARLTSIVRRSPRAACRISGRVSPAAWRRIAFVLRKDRRRIELAKRQISAVSAEIFSLATRCSRTRPSSEEFVRLNALQGMAEMEWAADPVTRRVIQTLETAYLTAFWESDTRSKLAPRRAQRALQKRAILFFEELGERLRRAN